MFRARGRDAGDRHEAMGAPAAAQDAVANEVRDPRGAHNNCEAKEISSRCRRNDIVASPRPELERSSFFGLKFRSATEPLEGSACQLRVDSRPEPWRASRLCWRETQRFKPTKMVNMKPHEGSNGTSPPTRARPTLRKTAGRAVRPP